MHLSQFGLARSPKIKKVTMGPFKGKNIHKHYNQD